MKTGADVRKGYEEADREKGVSAGCRPIAGWRARAAFQALSGHLFERETILLLKGARLRHAE
jgi:hypothetical protein